jgi:oxygen-independent coproporphyrinogen-3 oxidase
MKPFVVERIITKIGHLALIDNLTEITLETNPTSYETSKFYGFKAAGINRVSIGIQSLNEKDLQFLGRKHDVKQAIDTIESARLLFPKISFDLIYARTNQTLKDWQSELASAMQLASGHISLYQLVIEKGTPFYKLFNDGELTIPSSDKAADMYEWTNEYLKSQNYTRYEISNYSLASHECKHNLAYWQYNNYLGIGPGAHSRINIRNDLHSIMMWHKPEKWLQEVNGSGSGIQNINKLSQMEMVEEMLMMGLRLEKGIDINHLQKRTGKKLFEIIDIEAATHYKDLGLLTWYDEPANIKLTDKGLMLHSYVVPRLLAEMVGTASVDEGGNAMLRTTD